MDYFDFYEIAPSFQIDEGALKKLFLQKSREYHPDFFTMASEEKKNEILLLSSKNNEAYKILSNLDRRMKYILDEKNVLKGEGQDKLDQVFLMDMMDINESIMELQFDPDANAKAKINEQVGEIESNLFQSIQALLTQDFNSLSEDNFNTFKQYYLKKKYLKRLLEQLDKLN
jgi:DnaJ-domain-containing proteins 1